MVGVALRFPISVTVCPRYLSRLMILPFGAFKLKIISPTHVWFMLMVTLTPVTVAPAGTPVTANECVAPAALPSGTGTEIVPEGKLSTTGGGGGRNCVLNCIGVPAHTAGLAGVITGAGGFELTMIVVVYESFPVSGSLVAGVVDVATVILYAPPTEKLNDGLR